jgi:hypothetical protein
MLLYVIDYGSNRLATVLLYLSEGMGGGETVFPYADASSYVDIDALKKLAPKV